MAELDNPWSNLIASGHVIAFPALGARCPSASILEILPTATVWLVITAPVWAAIVAPAALGFGLVLFSIYWLWKSLGFASGVLIGYWRLQRAQQRIGWPTRPFPDADRLHHLVIVPTLGRAKRSSPIPCTT